MTEPKLRYVPLGGLGEVGLNMWALEWEGQVLVVDAGLMFPTEEMLGVDLVIPDVSWLLEEGRRVLGIFLTHGHEDHIGALAFVLKRLNVPVYGTRMTLGLARHRLKEHRILRESDLREVRAGDRVQLGPFRVETVAVCHSIPDGVALAIQTPVGRVVYTSDFKLDPDPLYGPPTDLERFRKLGDEGVLLLLSDSTNAERPGVSGKERDLVPVFEEIFRDAPGRIVVCTFASNIHRIQQVVSLAARHGRRLAVVGRSIQNAFETARELGHLEVPPGLVARIEDLAGDPRAVLLSAGSQGEPLSALSRFAAQRHNLVNVQAGDWVLLSARPIPGNERLVNRTINNLYRHGARVFSADTDHVHVSGHAHRDELRQLLEAVRPRYFIPVHGEYRQLVMHAELAREAGIADDRRLVVEDGRAVDLTDDSMRAGEEISAGFVFVDGVGIGDVERVVLRDRRHLAGDGILVITVAVDRENGAVLSGPELISRGFIEKDTSEDLMREAREEVLATVRKFQGGRPESEILREAVRDAASRLLHKRTRRRPMVIPVVTEI
ncbi:MAG: ribonuclease J [Chloroflexi bacterium]|nr:MAG: ribonuclease J [Chloroflexota bacterium]